uniref:Reverse transcriptase domain-containing protein n=1 Tax=Astyanax mexicanus TaxID=7994 RepID=A0A3B1IUE7_ASTMX
MSRNLCLDINEILDVAVSDHYCVFFTVSIYLNKRVRNNNLTKKRYIKASTANDFINILNNTPILYEDLDINEMVDIFNSKIRSVLDLVAPEREKRISLTKKTPWKTEQLQQLKRKCRKAERVYRKTKLHVHYDILKNCIEEYNKGMRTQRQLHFSKIIDENSNNPKFLFSIIDRLLNPTTTKYWLLEASPSKCESFAQFFNDKIYNIRSNLMSLKPEALIIFKPQSVMQDFRKISLTELHKIITQLSSATCTLDPIPTSFFKQILESVIQNVLEIINCSLDTGTVPDALKVAVVKPLLKKHNLDSSVFNNFRPISNLPFLSKILEKVVFAQVNEFLKNNDVFDKFQSGFRSGHSTETALVRIVNDLRVNSDRRQVSVLLLLDLSAAFDTVDLDILIDRLENWVGLSGTVLQWFKSYLKGRKFFVSLAEHRSNDYNINYGVPQGSVLGPLLFSLYMLPLGHIIKKHGVSYHSYADDTQLYISVEQNDSRALDRLTSCLTNIINWMNRNFLKLNEEKTEILIIGNTAEKSIVLGQLGNLAPQVTDEIRNLGVILDSSLTFKPHIGNVTRTAFYHLRNITRVRPFLKQMDAEKLIHAFVFSRLDYCNALFTGLPKSTTDRLQLVQNAAARVLTRTKKREHITPVLASLHWLPVSFRIDFKILLLVFKCLTGSAPQYISELLTEYVPDRALRSSGAALLGIPKMQYKKTGEAAFCFYAPKIWNSLPIHIRQSPDITQFKKQLKTHLYTLAFY